MSDNKNILALFGGNFEKELLGAVYLTFKMDSGRKMVLK
jgi:hypothetical protein